MTEVQQKESHKHYTEAIEKVRFAWMFKYSIEFIIMDYFPDLYITNFGEEHPGSTYYFSPRSLYQFGIVEFANGCDILYSYVYQ